MGQIFIGAANYTDLIKIRLSNELKRFEGRGLKCIIKENPAGKYTFISCSVADRGNGGRGEEDAMELFRHYIAEMLSDLIMCKWQKAMLGDIIRENYYYFSEEERRSIFQNALHYLEDLDAGDRSPIIVMRKKRMILAKLKEFLDTCNQIVIEGFIRFRLKEYIKDLHEAADKAVDDFLMDREYKEFIQLLKYFVDIQDSRTDMVNVVMRANGVFKLFDGRYRAIDSTYLEGFIMDLSESEINYEDLLISALITIAPREIVFHSGRAEVPPATLETIKNIFPQRVSLCRGCELCAPRNL